MEPENNKCTDNKALIIDAELAELADAISKAITLAHQVAGVIGRGTGGREVSLSITNLQQARHWTVDAHDLQEWR